MTCVRIAYPHPNTVAHNFHHSVTGLILHRSERYRICEIEGIRCYPGDGLIMGRNQIMKNFLTSGCDWLLCLDTDIGFQPDLIERLMDTGGQVVSALYRIAWEGATDVMGGHESWEPRSAAWRWQGSGMEQYETYEGVMRVDAVGAGCLLVHRDIAELVREKFGEEWWSIVRDPDTGETKGEDISFCWRLSELGVPILLDTGAKTSHYKGVWI